MPLTAPVSVFSGCMASSNQVPCLRPSAPSQSLPGPFSAVPARSTPVQLLSPADKYICLHPCQNDNLKLIGLDDLSHNLLLPFHPSLPLGIVHEHICKCLLLYILFMETSVCKPWSVQLLPLYIFANFAFLPVCSCPAWVAIEVPAGRE